VSQREIVLDQGKYTIIFNDETATLKALRYGEEWQDLTGNGLVLALFHEIEKLRSTSERFAVVIDDPTSDGFAFTQEEKDCLKSRDKIGAIHSLRRRLGIDLITAKRLVDRGRF
jgi:hypothetical protein